MNESVIPHTIQSKTINKGFCCSLDSFLRGVVEEGVMQKKNVLLGSALFLFAFLIRILFMNDGLFHHDSVQLAIAVEHTIQHHSLREAVGGKTGLVLLNVLLYPLLVGLLDLSTEFLITLTTIFFGAASIPLLYFLMMDVSKNRFLSLATSLLFSVSPLFFSLTTYAKSPGVAVFFSLLGWHFLSKSLQNNSKPLMVLAGLSLGFIFFVRPSEVLVVVPLMVFFFSFGKKIHLKKAFLLSFILPFFFLLSFFFLTQGTGFFHYLDVNSSKLQTSNFLLAIETIYLSVTLIGIPFLILGGYMLWKRKKKLLSVLLFWFLLLFTYNVSVHTFAPRYLTVAIVPLIVLMGYGIAYVHEQHHAAGWLILVLVTITLFISVYPLLSHRHDHSGGKELSQFVDSLSNDYAVVVGDEGPFFSYYTNSEIILYPYSDTPKRMQELANAINSSLQAGKDVFIPETNFILHHPSQAPKNVFRHLEDRFTISIAGTLVWENYHKAALKSEKYTVHIFEIENAHSLQNT